MSSSDEEDKFPVLKDIVKPGDESIIKTSRLGHEVIKEIEQLEQKTGNLSPAQISRGIAGKQVDQLVDEIVERHLDAMRTELKKVLSELLKTPGRNR